MILDHCDLNRWLGFRKAQLWIQMVHYRSLCQLFSLVKFPLFLFLFVLVYLLLAVYPSLYLFSSLAAQF